MKASTVFSAARPPPVFLLASDFARKAGVVHDYLIARTWSMADAVLREAWMVIGLP